MCFQDGALKEIVIPSTLREIGDNALERCDSLKIVHVGTGCALDIERLVGDTVTVRRQ